MTLWKLTPVDLADSNWAASSHRDVVIVRAPNEDLARDEAEKAFGVKTRFTSGGGVKAPPWKRSDLVTAKIIAGDIYQAEGPPEVLEPSFEADLKSEPKKK